jgi:ribonuclease P/MRP protein subunit POP5
MRLKILPSSLREKKRYIKFKVFSEEPISYSDLEQAIWNTCLDFFGEFGTSQLSLHLIKNLWDDVEQTGVLRCNHLSVPEVILALGLIQRLGDIRIRIKILKVSGTLRKLKQI